MLATSSAGEISWNICSSPNCVINWLDHWQTMLTGIGAIGAAAVSIHYLRKQIADTANQETARRRRRLTASRARLPLQLSETVQYSREVIALLRRYLDAAGANAANFDALAELPRPTLPEQALLAFETIIETTDDDEFSNLIADMIAEMQVLSSRLRGLATEAPGPHGMNLQAYLLNAAKVHAFAECMFAFARRQENIPPRALDWERVFAALRLNDLRADHYPELHAFVGRARDRAAESEAAPG